MTRLTYFKPRTRVGAAIAQPVALAASYAPLGCLRRAARPLVALSCSAPRPRSKPLIRVADRAIHLLVGDGVALRIAREQRGTVVRAQAVAREVGVALRIAREQRGGS